MSETTGKGLARTANDEFKGGYGDWVAIGTIAAVVLHFGLFVLVPQFRAADLSGLNEEMEAITLPPEVKIPPPPEQIARPATPKVAAVEVSEDVTIAPTTFETNPVENLPPPPSGGSPSDRPSFIPYDTPPKLRNPSQIRSLLQRFYPRNLREAGVGGRVELWLYVDKRGKVQKTQIKTSSGHRALDQAAGQVADAMIFVPAMNRDKKTDVWVSQWVTFEVR
ncbi:MAG: energy transducer TonB [Gemmatimonadota bacterium]